MRPVCLRIPVPFLAALGVLALSSGCYSSDLFEAPGSTSASDRAPAGAPRGVVVEVDPEWLEDLEVLPAEDLFEAVAGEVGVPSDLLESVAWATGNLSSVSDGALDLDGDGWFALTAEGRAEASRITDLDLPSLTGRVGDVVAAAALLKAGGDGADPVEIDAGWWPAVAGFPSLSVVYGDAFAGEVFELLQRGRISRTDAQTDREQPDVIVIPPRSIVGLPAPAGLPTSDEAPQYPRAVRWIDTSAAEPRVGGLAAIERIVLVATEASWAASLDGLTGGEVGAHYLVRRLDGEVTQLAAAEQSVRLGSTLGDAMVVALAAPTAGWEQWTPQLMESSARLVAFLGERHGVSLDSDHVAPPLGHDLGDLFPLDAWLDAASCFQQSDDCLVPSGAPEIVPTGGAERSSVERTSVPNVPYFYQYANSISPSASCQNTSIAMVLKWLGWSGTPDDITARFGKDLAQSPAGLAQVFNTLAGDAGLSARLVPRTSGTLAQFQAQLAANKPTIVHGYMTGYGHVMVATGYDGSAYIANDPAGKWSQTWKGGYPYGWSASVGKGIRYGKAAFEQAVATSNGSTYLPLWFHELTNVGDGGPVDESPVVPDEPAESASTPEDLDEMTSPPATGESSGGGEGFDWATVRFVTPEDGDVLGNPAVLRAVRDGGGETVEFWSGSERLAEPRTDNPADEEVEFWVLGERSLTARSYSSHGTLLASHTIRVNIHDTGDLLPTYSERSGLTYDLSATTAVTGVEYVEYAVNGYDLDDVRTGSSRAVGAGFPLRYTFSTGGGNRLLVARGYSSSGDLLAEGSVVMEVGTSGGAECNIVGTISCGGSVSADTSSSPGRTDLINGYPEIVGNYEGPELGYEFIGSGEVEVAFVSPQPSLYDLDILVLARASGTCSPADFVARMFNSGTFEAQAGTTYTFVVDGFAGDQGAFTLEVDCD